MGGGEVDEDDEPLSARAPNAAAAQQQKDAPKGAEASASAANSDMPPSHIEILPIACSRTLDEMLEFNHRLFLRAIAEFDDNWILKQSASSCVRQVKQFIESTRGGKPKGWLREMVAFAQVNLPDEWAENREARLQLAQFAIKKPRTVKADLSDLHPDSVRRHTP